MFFRMPVHSSHAGTSVVHIRRYVEGDSYVEYEPIDCTPDLIELPN